MAGIKETSEVLVAIKALAVAYKAAMADGSINIFDVRHLAAPISAVRAAVAGSADVKAELADLDTDETKVLLDLAVALLPIFFGSEV